MLIFDIREIGNNLLHVRKRAGLTQAEVAERAGLSDRTYADIERGTANMRLETLLRICTVLRITPNDILHREEDSTSVCSEILKNVEELPVPQRETALKLLDVYIHSLTLP
ncbi:MAG: helix-turn-helix transcriptional regulator [Oscillospiraceae bacterium]|nr:helix-turn-helix transcriptional regulator [Oscillospiraceae bacterium]